MKIYKYTIIGILPLLLWQCAADTKTAYSFESLMPPTFDSLPHFPTGNELTHDRVELGRLLFFDTRLSADGTVSCASCHKPGLAYADTLAQSPGAHGRFDMRNSPSLINVAWQVALFREGGVPSLEIQALAPFGNENEMDISMTEAVARIAGFDEYQKISTRAYGEVLNAYNAARALASFQRSLVSSGSRYDRYLTGDTNALSPIQLRGMKLFFSEQTQCASCHSGFLFTDQKYHNIGLYEDYADEGRGRLTLKTSDLGKMKTPSLRNSAITHPYMHDGSVAHLRDVVAFYNQGGLNHPNKDARIKPLALSEGEIDELVEFISALTDDGL